VLERTTHASWSQRGLKKGSTLLRSTFRLFRSIRFYRRFFLPENGGQVAALIKPQFEAGKNKSESTA
jgi:hypothetical protein